MIGLRFASRFCAIVITAATLSNSAACAEDASSSVNNGDVAGIWKTHYQQSFLEIIVNREHTAHVVWIMDGSHQMGTVRWRPAPNGIIVEGLPRFRFWRMPSEDWMKVEMEELPLDMLGGDWKKFPLAFHMKKQTPTSRPRNGSDRPLPEGWIAPTPSPDFGERAGKPRRIEE